MTNPYAIAAFSMLGGWMLAQVAAVAKDYVYRRYLRRAIIDELRQLYDELKIQDQIYSRTLQIAGSKDHGMERGAALPLSNFIFSNHYKDAALAFTRTQRTALQMIHAYIRVLNDGAERFTALTDSIYEKVRREKKTDPADFEVFQEMLRDQFRLVQTTKWHIHHYLTHPLFPELDPLTETHEEYLKFVEGIEGCIADIEASGQSLPRERFEKVYDPEAFNALRK